ncbi:hypothetical protein SLS62_010152 [Diatrype stigma]|uniref:N-acetyltransferase domain-containing protein n=1 Tax=Diatrype stigma TaxID=117547 RepID=A0AAN9UJ64_9PEZI
MTIPSEKRNVELAVESDIPRIVDIYYDAFPGERPRSIFPDTQSGRRWVGKAFEKSLGPRYEGGPESKVLVSRGPEGVPVAFALYRIWKGGSDPSTRSWRARWPPVTDGSPDMDDAALDGFYGPTDRSREFLMGDKAHIHLEVLGTLQHHQKQGRGKALVHWGTELADRLGLECYLEASHAGLPLYSASGYVARDVTAVVDSRFVYPMVRPAR